MEKDKVANFKVGNMTDSADWKWYDPLLNEDRTVRIMVLKSKNRILKISLRSSGEWRTGWLSEHKSHPVITDALVSFGASRVDISPEIIGICKAAFPNFQ